MSAARYDLEWDFDHRDMAQSSSGEWVKYDDYASLQAALREAIDGWVKLYLNGSPGPNADRIAALRAQFLDDK